MKLIDERGKLFGLVNPIDALVAASVLLVIGVAIFLVTNKGETTRLPGVKKSTIEQKYLVVELRPEIIPFLEQSTRVKDNLTKSDLGEIVDLEVTDSRQVIPTADGRLVEATSDALRDVVITVRGQGTASEAMIQIGSTIMLTNREFFIDTKYFRGKSTLVGLKVVSD